MEFQLVYFIILYCDLENSKTLNDLVLKEFENIKEEYKTTDELMEIEIKDIAENNFTPVGVSDSIKYKNI